MPIDTFLNRVILASVLGLGVVVAIRLRARPWVFVVVLVVAVVALAWATPGSLRNGFHGQMHWAYSLTTMRTMPPEDPGFAGEPLLYPWAGHWVYARLARLLHVTPLIALALTDVVWISVMLLSTALAARLLTKERVAGVAAAYLAWTGMLLTETVYIDAMGALHSDIRACMRMVPADKFFNPNGNPIGLGLSALGVLCVVRLMMRARCWGWSAAGLFVAAGGCAIAYPISYVGLVAMVGAGAVVLAVVRKRLLDERVVRCVVAVALAGAVALPLMLMYERGRGPEARIVLTPLAGLLGKAAMLAAVVWPIAIGLGVVAYRWRRSGGEDGADVRATRAMLLGGIAGLWLTYLTIAVPLRCEYKFVAQSAAPIAVLMAWPIARLVGGRGWRMIAGWAALAACSMGAADRVLLRVDMESPLEVRFSRGRASAVDAERDALFTFLREKTPIDSVVISEDPLVMTIGERSLYLMPDSCGRVVGDGWSMSRWTVNLAVIGHPKDEFLARGNLEGSLLHARNSGWARDVAKKLRLEFSARAVYVVVTEPGPRAAIGESGAWESVYRGERGEVFELRRE